LFLSPIRLVYVCGYNSHDPFTGQAGKPDNDRAVAAGFAIFRDISHASDDLPPPGGPQLTSSLPKILTIGLALGPRVAPKVGGGMAHWWSLQRVSLLRLGLRMRVEA